MQQNSGSVPHRTFSPTKAHQLPRLKLKGHLKVKKVKNGKKVFQPALGCAQHPKASQKTQQTIISKFSSQIFISIFFLYIEVVQIGIIRSS